MPKMFRNSNARALVSKDEDEPLRSPLCFETHRSPSSSWAHVSPALHAPQHEGELLERHRVKLRLSVSF
jgi:hypothetical protein